MQQDTLGSDSVTGANEAQGARFGIESLVRHNLERVKVRLQKLNLAKHNYYYQQFVELEVKVR